MSASTVRSEIKPYDVLVSGNVRAPLSRVWAEFRKFGPGVMEWWSIAKSVAIDGGGEEKVGCVRVFHSTSGYVYHEELVERNDDSHTLVYRLRSSDPALPGLRSVTTTIALESNIANQTTMTWTNKIDADPASIAIFKPIQAAVYRGAIHDLDRYMAPPMGTLTVDLVSANGPATRPGSLDPAVFVVVELDGADLVSSLPAAPGSAPVFNQSIPIDVTLNTGRLHITLFDARYGRHHALGAGIYDIHQLTAGKTETAQVALEPAGWTVTLKLALELREGTALPPVDQTKVKQAQLGGLMAALAELQARVTDTRAGVLADVHAPYGYARYERNLAYPDVALEELPRRTEGLPGPELLTAQKVGMVMQQAFRYLHAQVGYKAKLEDTTDPFRMPFGGEVVAPALVMDRWKDDDELCRQLLAGLNPHVIERLRDLTRVPPAMQSLTHGGQDLKKLVEQRRLFMLDYEPLDGMSPYKGMLVLAPIVLLVQPERATDARPLEILGIQLSREGGNQPVYSPGSSTPNKYLLAKAHVMCADVQMHQWIYHLGLAHLVMEPFAISIHNALPAAHPVARLLKPHFKDTIGINFLARRTLVSETTPFTDTIFATGTVQALKMVLGAWKKFQFDDYSFPRLLKDKGFEESDGLVGYHYRDDGFRIWNAVGHYVRDCVMVFYRSDEAVAKDPALAAWCRESCDPDRAAIPGFPEKIETRERLAEVLQIIIVNMSVQHSTVNYPQMQYQSYVPNRPPALYRSVPNGPDDVSTEYLLSALPNPQQTHFQAMFSFVLSAPSPTPLSSISVMEDLCPDAHDNFQRRLAAIGRHIDARNSALLAMGIVPYPYLHPDNVAASVEI